MTDVLIHPAGGAGTVESADRLFSDVLKIVLPDIVKQGPKFLGYLKSWNRELDLNDGDAARDLGDFLAASVDTIIDLVPKLVEQVKAAHREIPSDTRDPETYDRFWGSVVSAIAPYALKYGKKYGGQLVKKAFGRELPGGAPANGSVLVPMLVTSVVADNLDAISRAVNGTQ